MAPFCRKPHTKTPFEASHLAHDGRAWDRPSDYDPTQGARFEVHIEKGRGLHGEDAKPFEAQLEVRDGACYWTLREITDVNEARIAALLDDGLSIRDIADETGIPKSTVARIKKKLEARQGVREEDD
jgi:putative DNA primase/helicase